jgi:hypothetical protein
MKHIIETLLYIIIWYLMISFIKWDLNLMYWGGFFRFIYISLILYYLYRLFGKLKNY